MNIAPQATLEAPEDVAANANGMLTAAQDHALRRMLWRAQGSTMIRSGFMFAFSLAVLTFIAWIWWRIMPLFIIGRDPLSFTRSFHGISATFPGLRLIFAVITLAWVRGLWQSAGVMRACARVRSELRPGRILSSDCMIVPHGNRTVALMGGRILTPWDGEAFASVPPGHFRCWFLPHLGQLLSVQRLQEWERPTGEDEAVATRWGITAMNGFDAASLPKNRAGRLTAPQARYIVRCERSERPGTLLGGAVVLLIGLWLGFSLWHFVWHGGVGAIRNAGVTDIFWELAAAVLFTAMGCVLLRRGFGGDGYRLDLREGRVVIHDGPVAAVRETGDDSNSVSYSYRIAGTVFSIPRRAYESLADGLTYRLYCTPRSKRLVNIEWAAPTNESNAFGRTTDSDGLFTGYRNDGFPHQ